MASRATFKRLAKKLIKSTAGDIAGPASFAFKVAGSFDYANQTYSEVWPLNINKVFVSFKKSQEYNAEDLNQLKVSQFDAKMYVVFDDMTIEPDQATSVVFNGKEYTIADWTVDAADAAYVFMLRA